MGAPTGTQAFLLPATIFEFSGPTAGGDAKLEKREVPDLCQFLSKVLPETTTPCFIFMNTTKNLTKGTEDTKPLLRQLEKTYGVPRQLWSKPYWESNGYFGCKELNTYLHNTWFFFLVKQITELEGKEKEFPKVYDYTWYKMAFFSSWTRSNEGSRSILCMNCPPKIMKDIEDYLLEYIDDLSYSPPGDPARYQFTCDPYAFHQAVIHGVIHAYDRSVWKIKDIVRAVEKDRSADTDYHSLHEAARHVIHSTETLTNANEVMSALISRHREYTKRNREMYPDDTTTLEYNKQTEDHLTFHRTVLFGIKCRSESLQSRHTNEISLALNLVTALDTKFMKAIAVLTVLFLPATTIATIFGMSFFNYNPGGDENSPSTSSSPSDFSDNEWTISNKFWVFWAWVIPCTLAVPLFFVKDLFKSVEASIKNFIERVIEFKKEHTSDKTKTPASSSKV